MKIKMLHWTAWVTRYGYSCSEDIHQWVCIATTLDKPHKARFQWYGHIFRADIFCKIVVNLSSGRNDDQSSDDSAHSTPT
ncbi:hypothetical protein Y032_0149g2698 [Ancylostoma ceylanicum]|uniref:Uncharacterized protein n=1 Tax=Ancylostoma ceylanicum TaxID=53326 RepID=A0A016T1X1_9BILA|nr:hypothetical protein Y032_0149g2698 [Ancylostoma ceylanicum]